LRFLVQHKDIQVVIDGGPSKNSLAECLSENIAPWDREIEMMILTHPDADHLTGLIDVLENYSVSQVVVNFVVKESADFWEFHQKALVEGAQIYSPQAGDKFKLGLINFSVLWPQEKLGDERVWRAGEGELAAGRSLSSEVAEGLLRGGTERFEILGAATVSDEANETSIVLKLSFGSFDALLAGDIGFATENKIDFPEVEVLKIPHHGSRYSTSDDLLKESLPELAIISVGKNFFGHPTEEVIEKLSNLEIRILRTDQEGGIEIVSDGASWKFIN